METIKKIFKKSGYMSILEAIIFLILGIVLICFPVGSVKFIIYVMAAIFIVVGILKVVNYFITKGNYDFYSFDLAYGIVAIVIGIVVIAFSGALLSVFRIVVGIWIIYSALIRLNSALKLKKVAPNVWVPSLVLAIIMFICGLFVIINSGSVAIITGVTIVIYSIIDIAESIIFIRNVKETL